MCTTAALRPFARECYTTPEELVETLLRRGMGLLTVTDHDSIGAADELRRFPNFFLSEEVTCRTAAGTECHIGVYDIDERQHFGLQERRDDLPRLAAYLQEQQLFAAVNHVVSSLTGRRDARDFLEFQEFPAFEGLNGQVSAANNACARLLAGRWGKLVVGGSDAHTALSAGRACTEVPGARNAREFFAGLRTGRGRLHGADGRWWSLTRDVLHITGCVLRERPLAALLTPLAPLIPAITGWQFLADGFAARCWSRLASAPAEERAIPWVEEAA